MTLPYHQPTPAQPLNLKDGRIDETWYRFFSSMLGSLGGGNSQSTLDLILPQNGGTGVQNPSDYTITLSGAFSTTGPAGDTLTLTLTGDTSLTLPTSGRLLTAPAGATVAGDVVTFSDTKGNLQDSGVLLSLVTDQLAAIGEYQSVSIPSGSAVSLTSGTIANIATLTLQAGEWNIAGMVVFAPAVTTTIAGLLLSISTVSGVIPAAPNDGASTTLIAPLTTGQSQSLPAGSGLHVSIAAPTTYYLVAGAAFAVSTMTAFGFIGATRVSALHVT